MFYLPRSLPWALPSFSGTVCPAFTRRKPLPRVQKPTSSFSVSEGLEQAVARKAAGRAGREG